MLHQVGVWWLVLRSILKLQEEQLHSVGQEVTWMVNASRIQIFFFPVQKCCLWFQAHQSQQIAASKCTLPGLIIFDPIMIWGSCEFLGGILCLVLMFRKFRTNFYRTFLSVVFLKVWKAFTSLSKNQSKKWVTCLHDNIALWKWHITTTTHIVFVYSNLAIKGCIYRFARVP